MHRAGRQLNHVVLHPKGEIEWSALAHPLPRSRAFRFAPDLTTLHIGSDRNTVTVTRDWMLVVLTEQHAVWIRVALVHIPLRGSLRRTGYPRLAPWHGPRQQSPTRLTPTRKKQTAPRPSSRTFQKRPELCSASVLGHNHQDGNSSPRDELRQRQNSKTQHQNRNPCFKNLREISRVVCRTCGWS